MTVKSAEQTNLYYVALHLWQGIFTVHIGKQWNGETRNKE